MDTDLDHVYGLVELTDDPRRAAMVVPEPTLPVRARTRWALEVAQLAPSIHNTQPWRWYVDAPPDVRAHVELRVDASRHLPAVDPDGRQQEISCGCALGALLVGADAAGLAIDVELVPRTRPGVLARVALTNAAPPSAVALDRLSALRRRRSARGWFTDEAVPTMVRTELERQASQHGVTTREVGTKASERDVLDHLIALATLRQYEGEDIPAEVRAWTRESGDPRRDGVPAFAWERTSRQTADGALVLRDFACERKVPGAIDSPLIEPYPTLLLLSTPDDGRFAHMTTGLALLDLLVAAQRVGFAVGHVNQAIEDRGTRARLARELRIDGSPQLLLRIGRAAQPPRVPTPRRSLADVLDPRPRAAAHRCTDQ